MKTDLLALLRRVDRAHVTLGVSLRRDIKTAIAEMEQALGPLASFPAPVTPTPCTWRTRNNPGCRCDACIQRRDQEKQATRHATQTERVRRSEARKRAAPWEGRGR